MKTGRIVLGTAVLLVGTGLARGANYTWSPLTISLSSGATPLGISGGTIVGNYVDGGGVGHGFVYDGTTSLSVTHPQAATSGAFAGGATTTTGADGGTIVGSYVDASGNTFGYSRTGSSYQTISNSLGSETLPSGITGGLVVGTYYAKTNGAATGFTYDGASFTPLSHPLQTNAGFLEGTFATAISGGTVAGYYQDSTFQTHGFTFDGTSWSTLDDPLSGGSGTEILGISGNLKVGYYGSGAAMHGFFFDGTTWTDVSIPAATIGTELTGVSGNTAVGYYVDGAGRHAFTAVLVPEPASIGMLSIAAMGLIVRRRR